MVALVGLRFRKICHFADLFARYHDVPVKYWSIDINIRDLRSAVAAQSAGIVTQESILFNDTVFNNIAFGIDNEWGEDD